MPKQKIFISKRHARRKKRNFIFQLMSRNADEVAHVSCRTDNTIPSFQRSIGDNSSSNVNRDNLEEQSKIDQNESDSDPMSDCACNSVDSCSVAEVSTDRTNTHFVLCRDSDFHDDDEALPDSEGKNENVVNSEICEENNKYEICSSGDSTSDSDVYDRNQSNNVTYTFTVDPTHFTERFRTIIIKNNATSALTTEILHLLNPILPFLPKDARTMLQTPKKTQSIKLGNGELCYFGIETGIQNKLKGCVLPAGQIIQLDFNIDGLPLFKSSATEFWPILGRICSIDNQEPFAIAIFCGKGKPQPQELFLSQFINEVQVLQNNGIRHENSVHEVAIRCFSCDAPARSWLKCIKSHSAKAACERCTIFAEVRDKILFYPTTNVDCLKRRDDDFRQHGRKKNKSQTKNTEHDERKAKQREHIIGKSLLLRIPSLGLVTQFILDPMHLIYLGVVKRLFLKYWVDGKRPFKLSLQNLQTADNIIHTIRFHIPSDFARKGRSLSELKRFKATELRLVLLYTGPIFLHDIISEDKYAHFTLLHAAITILSSRSHIFNYLHIAKDALNRFVTKCSEIYGNEFVVYNVHSLCHVADDVENYGPLDNYSCFAFENYLKTLKHRIRAKTGPLQQISNRIYELNTTMTKTRNRDISAQYCPIGVTYPVDDRRDEHYFECKSLKCDNMKISSHRPNNVISANGKIYVIKKIFCIHGEYKCIGTSFRYMRDLYKDPLPSSKLNIFYGTSLGDLYTFSVNQISFKCVMMPFKEGFAIFPVIHQL